jgi:dipeptidyl aminopeptidase/acylaminoacyl peptidase
MKRIIQGLICFALSVAWAAAQQKSVPAGLPPLIDREVVFGNPEISFSQLSPDGQYLTFLKPWKGTRNIYVKGVNAPFSSARLLTTESERPILDYFWSRDSKYILYTRDNNGDENYNVFVVDPSAQPAAGAEAPVSRNLTDLKGVRAQIVTLPKSDPDVIYIGLNDRDPAWHDLYSLKISTGEKTLVRANTDRISEWVFDQQGKLRLALRNNSVSDHEILRVDAKGFTKVLTCSVFESCTLLRFQEDGKHVYLQANHGNDIDLMELALLDPETGKTTRVGSDPLKKVDLAQSLFSEVTGNLVATVFDDDRRRYYFADKSFASDFKRMQSRLGGLDIRFLSRSDDDHLWLVAAYSDREPGVVCLFDRKSGKLALQYKSRENLPRELLAEMKPIRYQSSDGLEIHAYLILPKGVPAKNLPTLVIPHGGPWDRYYWECNVIAQFFANRGYAVLLPNFRASVGYGKKFVDAGNHEWGGKIQDDVTWGVKYLIAQGIADPKRVGIRGASFGGYTTLAGVAFTPDLYAAAVDIVGPSNIITLLDSVPPYWEAVRIGLYARMGDPTTAEGRAQMMKHSPANFTGNIKTPLLVAQGANDPRVNRSESERIVVALRDRGAPVEYLLAPDEGHGFYRSINSSALYLATEKFLARYLGGRCQEDALPEVVARLTEITVDPKTVVLAKEKEKEAGTSVTKP